MLISLSLGVLLSLHVNKRLIVLCYEICRLYGVVNIAHYDIKLYLPRV